MNSTFDPKLAWEPSQEEDLAIARSTIQKMDRLFEDEDFKFLHTQMQENLDNKVRSLLSPPNGLDGVVNTVHLQGKIAGFSEAMGFAALLKNGAEATVATLAYLDQREGEENGTRE